MTMGRWVTVVVSMAVACGGAPVPAKPTPAPGTNTWPPPQPAAGEASSPTLAARVATRLRALLPDARVEERDAGELRVWPIGGKGGAEGLTIFLDNLRDQCKADGACDAAIESFARKVAATATIDDPKLAIESILPALKTAAYVTEATKGFSDDGRLLAVPVVDDLRLVLVQDLPSATRFLSEKDLHELGLTLEQLQARALENLQKRPQTFTAQELAPGLYGLTAGDGYDSAMFLLHDDWRAFKPKVRGELVVAPVARDMVFVTGDQEPAALTALARVLENERAQPQAAYPITTQAYRWTKTGWARFDPR